MVRRVYILNQMVLLFPSLLKFLYVVIFVLVFSFSLYIFETPKYSFELHDNFKYLEYLDFQKFVVLNILLLLITFCCVYYGQFMLSFKTYLFAHLLLMSLFFFTSYFYGELWKILFVLENPKIEFFDFFIFRIQRVWDPQEKYQILISRWAYMNYELLVTYRNIIPLTAGIQQELLSSSSVSIMLAESERIHAELVASQFLIPNNATFIESALLRFGNSLIYLGNNFVSVVENFKFTSLDGTLLCSLLGISLAVFQIFY